MAVILTAGQIAQQSHLALKTLPGVMLDDIEIEACLTQAMQLYLAYAGSNQWRPDPFSIEQARAQPIEMGEWVDIRKLFLAYVEQANANLLESAQPAGVPIFGKSSSEAASLVGQLEESIQQKAFSENAVTLRYNYEPEDGRVRYARRTFW
ncbi:MAG: hypothetical protein VXW65_07205 [Pseudomonadota bacterium]|nr:hypothetical protein [Pseudomonadota bacterium]